MWHELRDGSRAVPRFFISAVSPESIAETIMAQTRIASLAASSLLVLVAGCFGSGNTGTVTGKVTLDGSPLADAVVTFVPESGEQNAQNAIGRTDQAGNYQLFRRDEPGATIGKYTVRITGTPAAASTQSVSSDDAAYLAQVSGASSGSGSTTAFKDPVPAKYNTQTELNAAVEKGANTFDFDLQSK